MTTVNHVGHGSRPSCAVGFRTVSTMRGIINTPNTISNARSGRRLIVSEPISEPTSVGASTGITLERPSTPRRRKATVADAVEVRMPRRFDPFALLPGTPASTSSGTVNMDPPPATVLMMPAITPPPANNNISHHVTRVHPTGHVRSRGASSFFIAPHRCR